MEAHFGFPSLSSSRATARDGEREGTRPEDHEEVCARTGVPPSGYTTTEPTCHLPQALQTTKLPSATRPYNTSYKTTKRYTILHHILQHYQELHDIYATPYNTTKPTSNYATPHNTTKPTSNYATSYNTTKPTTNYVTSYNTTKRYIKLHHALQHYQAYIKLPQTVQHYQAYIKLPKPYITIKPTSNYTKPYMTTKSYMMSNRNPEERPTGSYIPFSVADWPGSA